MRTCERANVRTYERTNVRTCERTNVQTYERVNMKNDNAILKNNNAILAGENPMAAIASAMVEFRGERCVGCPPGGTRASWRTRVSLPTPAPSLPSRGTRASAPRTSPQEPTGQPLINNNNCMIYIYHRPLLHGLLSPRMATLELTAKNQPIRKDIVVTF